MDNNNFRGLNVGDRFMVSKHKEVEIVDFICELSLITGIKGKPRVIVVQTNTKLCNDQFEISWSQLARGKKL